MSFVTTSRNLLELKKRGFRAGPLGGFRSETGLLSCRRLAMGADNALSSRETKLRSVSSW